MTRRHRLIGLNDGAVGGARPEINFTLALENGQTMSFVARYGAVMQLIGTLGELAGALRQALIDQGLTEPVALQALKASHVQKDRWSDSVQLFLTGENGIHTGFHIPCRTAAHIAEQLKTESEKATQTGTA